MWISYLQFCFFLHKFLPYSRQLHNSYLLFLYLRGIQYISEKFTQVITVFSQHFCWFSCMFVFHRVFIRCWSHILRIPWWMTNMTKNWVNLRQKDLVRILIQQRRRMQSEYLYINRLTVLFQMEGLRTFRFINNLLILFFKIHMIFFLGL